MATQKKNAYQLTASSSELCSDKEEGEITSTDISSDRSSVYITINSSLDDTVVPCRNGAANINIEKLASKEEGEITSTDISDNNISEIEKNDLPHQNISTVGIDGEISRRKHSGKEEDENTDVSADLLHYTSETKQSLISISDDSTLTEKRAWLNEKTDKNKKIVTKVRTGVVDENKNLIVRNKSMNANKDQTRINVSAESDTTGVDNKKQVFVLGKKRKRNLSDLGEFTPKRLYLPHYSNDETISPIELAVSAKNWQENQVETPIINAKFDFSVLEGKQIFNSTPICGGKVRKSIFGNVGSDSNEIKTKSIGSEAKQSCAISTKQSCATSTKQSCATSTKQSCATSTKYSAVGSSAKEKHVPDIFSQSYFSQKGRFTGVEANVSKVDMEAEEMTEDILGLEDATYMAVTDNSASNSEETLIAGESTVEDKEIEKEGPELEEEKLVLQEEIRCTIQEEPNCKTVTIPKVVKPTDTGRETIYVTVEVNKDTEDDRTSKVTEVRRVDNQVKKISETKGIPSGQIGNKIGHTVKIVKESVTSKKNKKPSQGYLLDNSQYADLRLLDTSQMRQNDLNSLMTTVRKRWDSQGIPREDTNLTTAMTFKQKAFEQGLKYCDGYLEGEKLCSLNLKEQDLNKNIDRNIIVKEYNRRLQKIHQSHVKELQALYNRQNLQHKQLRCLRLMPMVKQQRIMQMGCDHQKQQMQLQQNHRLEYDALQTWLKRAQSQCSIPLQGYGNQKKGGNNKYKYGPERMVALTKGPCRETHWKKTKVNLSLPHVIGRAAALEDDIYDHFYAY